VKTKDQKDVVNTALINAADALDEARNYLDKLCAAHLLVMGAWDPGDSIFDAAADARIRAFGENAANVVAHIECLESYFDEIREAVGLSAKQSPVRLVTDQAAEE
jgi:hypothetical protein